MAEAPDLGALIAARICHDLAGPLGAVGNGVELLALAGADEGADEMALIAQSTDDAGTRLRLFRLAYGRPVPGQIVTRAEALQLLPAVSRAGRVSFLWQVEGDQPRDTMQAVFLALQCIESALPFGGEVQMAHGGREWRLTALSPRLEVDRRLWGRLTGAGDGGPLAPAEVQFALLPRAVAQMGRVLAVETQTGGLVMRF